MDDETREHIFEPFFTTKELGKGTGLGLATSYGIVRQAGGHIWLYSEPGHGSSFKLYFPRAEAPVVEEAPDPGLTETGRGLVLVVEDDPAVRNITSKLLERSGFRVRAVEDGASALSAFEGSAERIDAVVTDVIMPNMSGIELVDRLHAIDPTVGLILLSGYTAKTLDLDGALALGAIFIAKPITSRDLVAAIGRAMRREPVTT